MADRQIANLLPRLRTRQEYFDYLDDWTVTTVDELHASMSSRALVKGYLLETSSKDRSGDVIAALSSEQQRVVAADDALYSLRWHGDNGDWAIVEVEDQRYPILYTALDSATADVRVDQLVRKSPLLDKAWFAAPLFLRLWQMVLAAYPPHRFSQVVFEHESLFETLSEPRDSDTMLSEGSQLSDEDDEAPVSVERRRARMQITERLGELARALPAMRSTYAPLESIVRLRVPAPNRGGHDVYFDGKFTNRSDSVTLLRQTILTTTCCWPDYLPAREPISAGLGEED